MRARRISAVGAVAAVLSMAACSGQDGPADAAAGSALSVGDCLNVIDGVDGEAGSVATVPCEEPHAGEVVLAAAAFFAEDGQPPAEDRLQVIADTACEEAMVSYAGQSSAAAGVQMSYLHPSQESWEAGDRSLTCIAVAVDATTGGIGRTTGSLAAR
jgi:hypothetical protein